ncbi:MAG: glycosyltransferase, partial [Solirubrobacterales bacterium]|nr:glycosyltransferase [Solirubrobacterales bacterium]
VDLDRFVPEVRGERLLVVSRLREYKRVDLVIEAATRAKLPLDIVGDGPAAEWLRSIAGPTVRFHGKVSDPEVTRLMQGCRAFCLPGEEDFGMAPVEAQAAGKPVVAFGRGGVTETVIEGETGAFFDEQTPVAFLDALARCDALPADPARIGAHAQRFSRQAFRRRLSTVIEEARATV